MMQPKPDPIRCARDLVGYGEIPAESRSGPAAR